MHKIDRRKFLKTLLAASGATLPAACVTRPARKMTLGPSGLPVRTLGRTGEAVTIAGLGGAWIAKGTAEEGRMIVDAAFDAGIRYFDTAPNYGGSEDVLGAALKGRRDQVFLTTKLDHVPYAEAQADLEHSLKRLKTDHVDLLLLHGVGLPNDFGDADACLAPDGVLQCARDAKKKGLTRFIGMSVHRPNAAPMKVLDNAGDDIDVVMPFINSMVRKEQDPDGDIVRRCAGEGIGLVAMKVLGGSGQLATDYDAAFRFALSQPGVACAIIGVRTPREARRAAEAARDFRPLSARELKDMLELGAHWIQTNAREYTMLYRHFHADRCVTV